MSKKRDYPRRTFLKIAAAGAAAISSRTIGNGVRAEDAAPGDRPPSGEPGLNIVTFKVDVTPPIGEPLAFAPNEKVDAPIYVSGVVLDDGKTRVAWVSCDYLSICGESYVAWAEAVAEHAGTTRENVFLHSVHQHDSIRLAPEYNPKEGEDGGPVVTPAYCEKSLKDVTGAIAAAVAGPWHAVGKLLTGETRVGGLAANRRLVDENGKFVRNRFSGVNPPKLQAWPVGKIDPILRTVCFENTEGKRVAALHFYATHPMAAYGRKRVGPDAPGWALRYVERQDDSGALNIYFTGCGGDITFGKYNVLRGADAIALLGKRLGDGILKNLDRLEERPITPIEVKRIAFDVPFNPAMKPASECKGEHARERRYLTETIDLWRRSTVGRMSIGPMVHFLSCELAEVFVDYQLYAQSLIPERFLATASYGNGVYWYIPTRAAFEEQGGYETGDRACVVTPEIDGVLRKAIREVLHDVMHGPDPV